MLQNFQHQDDIMSVSDNFPDNICITKLMDDCMVTPPPRQASDREWASQTMGDPPSQPLFHQVHLIHQAQEPLPQGSQQPCPLVQPQVQEFPQEAALQGFLHEVPQVRPLSHSLMEIEGVLNDVPQEAQQGTPVQYLPVDTRDVYYGLSQYNTVQEAHQDMSVPTLSLETLQIVPQSSQGAAETGHASASASASTSPSPSPPLQMGGKRGKRSSNVRQPKLYERTEKFADPELEKRRLDAINSKKNRVRKAEALAKLRQKVQEYTRQRDLLVLEVETLRRREKELMQQLSMQPTASPQCNPTPPPPYNAHHMTLNPPLTPHTTFLPLTPPATPYSSLTHPPTPSNAQ